MVGEAHEVELKMRHLQARVEYSGPHAEHHRLSPIADADETVLHGELCADNQRHVTDDAHDAESPVSSGLALAATLGVPGLGHTVGQQAGDDNGRIQRQPVSLNGQGHLREGHYRRGSVIRTKLFDHP